MNHISPIISSVCNKPDFDCQDYMTAPSDLPVSSFSIIGDADLDCGVVLLHNVAPLLCNWLLHKFPIESNVELFAVEAGVQHLWSLPHHVVVIICTFICRKDQ